MKLVKVVKVIASWLVATVAAFATEASAQTTTPAVEVGVHVTALRLSEFSSARMGAGGRVTFNITDRIALEGEVTGFSARVGAPTGGRLQALAGIKAGRRGQTFGVFAKARPGFLRFARTPIGCIAIFPAPLVCMLAEGRTAFLMDVGGVVEIYPSSPIVIRVDVGDAIVRYGSGPFRRPSGEVRNSLISHNWQLGVGFGIRF